MRTTLSMWRSLASVAGIAFLAVGAWAQAAPATPDNSAEEPEEKEIPVKWNSLTLSYGTWNTGGSLYRLNQYGKVPAGLSLSELKLFSPGDGIQPYALLNWRGTWNQDRVIDGLFIGGNGRSIVKFSMQDRFYNEASWSPVGTSQDRIGTASVEQSITPNIGAFASYRADERDQQFTAPKDAQHSRSKMFAVGVQGKVGSSNIGVSGAERRFYDSTGLQPQSLQRQINGHIDTDVTPYLSLTGTGSSTTIEQSGRMSGSVKSVGMAGTLDLGPKTSLQFNVARDDFDLADMIETGYAQQRFTTGVRLSHKVSRWNLQFGYRHREVEQVRADRSFVDVPTWNTYDFRLSSRFRNGLRLTLRGNWDDLTRAAVPTSEDPRQLLWDDKAMGQVKVDGGDDRFNGYASYTYRFRQNREREVEIGTTQIALGGSYVISPKLLCYGEWSYESVRATGVAEATGESLDDFFPVTGSVAFGVDWARTDNDSVSASLNSFGTHNSRGTQVTFQYQRRLKNDQSLGLVVAPWRFDDRLYGLTGYRSTLASVNYSAKF